MHGLTARPAAADSALSWTRAQPAESALLAPTAASLHAEADSLAALRARLAAGAAGPHTLSLPQVQQQQKRQQGDELTRSHLPPSCRASLSAGGSLEGAQPQHSLPLTHTFSAVSSSLQVSGTAARRGPSELAALQSEASDASRPARHGLLEGWQLRQPSGLAGSGAVTSSAVNRTDESRETNEAATGVFEGVRAVLDHSLSTQDAQRCACVQLHIWHWHWIGTCARLLSYHASSPSPTRMNPYMCQRIPSAIGCAFESCTFETDAGEFEMASFESFHRNLKQIPF